MLTARRRPDLRAPAHARSVRRSGIALLPTTMLQSIALHVAASRALRGVALGVAAALPLSPAAQPHGDEELQKKLANPVSDLITVPLQFTTTLHAGPYERPQHTLNIQPVYPVGIGGGWSLVNRLIVPVLSNPAMAPGQDRENGLGDIVYEGFFSPAASGGLVWGVGPILQMRTATDERLGAGKWSTGPAVVVLQQEGRWSLGALLTQLWSFTGDNSRADVSRMEIQPVINYRLDPQHSIAYSGTIVADWKQNASNRWTVPLGATYSILTKPPGFVPVNYIMGGGYNVVRPDFAGDWFLRFQVNFVLPK
jgi:hypothetical protein